MSDITMLTIALRTIRSIGNEYTDRVSRLRVAPSSSLDGLRSADRIAEDQLVDFGFAIRDGSNGFSISFQGIRASSCAGIGCAMFNWAAAAERRIGA